MYEYKLVVVRPEKDSDGDYLNSIPMDTAIEEINQLGLEGWVVRSHQMNLTSSPIMISYLLGRKLDITNNE